MQNVAQGSGADNNPKIEKVVNVNQQQQQHHDIGNSSSTPHSHSTTNSSPAKSETETYSEHRQYMSDSSESEEDSVSEVESFVIDEGDTSLEAAKFLLNAQQNRTVDPLTQARIEQLLQAAGIGQLATKDGKHLADPEVLRRLTSSVSSALDEAAAALTRMRSDTGNQQAQPEKTSLVEACTDGDVGTVRKLLTEGRSVHETSEEGESLLSLACSAGYFELAQVLLAMNANVEDRGIKGECTPLMEAASAGHLDIVRLLVAHGADVNAQSTTGNTPLMYGCAGGHQDVVKFLLESGANVEDHNENGHTPLMEAASAGHVGLAKILLMHGAGINTHSNEFKESALTLACYKGHLDMVKFLLEAGADQEHKTDEMHTALMEASMDGHVEVARLLLDSGAQVNMPTDSFESPLTLAACGGHVDLAMLLIERGANIEEVNDEGYTPLMEAAREGHEDMVALLLNQGAHINAQTDETQETALTLACCGGFTEVADYLFQAGADIELGASTPLMEAAQEGHLELVKYLLEKNANVHAQTQTGDTALTYACENGHTDVADLLLQYGADLEHESEGGRTPLMKACRAGHQCTVQFLISKGANVRRQTTNNDHTPLSLACAGGHLNVVELLLANRADPNHKLKDNSTMLIEAAKGGHTTVVQLLLDYPHSMMMNQPSATAATMLPGHVSPLPNAHPSQRMNFFQSATDFSPAVLQEVPEAVRIVPQEEGVDKQLQSTTSPSRLSDTSKDPNKGSARTSGVNVIFDATLTTAEAQQVRTQPLTLSDFDDCDMYAATATMEFLAKQGPGFIEKNKSILEYVKNRKKQANTTATTNVTPTDEGSTQKQQILEELHRVDREFSGKQQQQQQQHTTLFPTTAVPQDDNNQTVANNATLPHRSIIDIDIQDDGMGGKRSLFPVQDLNAFYAGVQAADLIYQTTQNQQPAFCFAPISMPQQPSPISTTQTPTTATPMSVATPPIKIQTIASHSEVSQNTAISDRPKAKPVSKKEGKNIRKVYSFQQLPPPQVPLPSLQADAADAAAAIATTDKKMLYPLDLDALGQLPPEDPPDTLTTSNFLQDLHNHPLIRAAFVSSPQAAVTSNTPTNQQAAKKSNIDNVFKMMDEDLQCFNIGADVAGLQQQTTTQVTAQFPESLDESMIASLANQQHELVNDHDGDVSRVEYFAVPNHGVDFTGGVQHTFDPYEQYLQAVGNNASGTMPPTSAAATIGRKGSLCRQTGFQANISLMQHTLGTETVTTAIPVIGMDAASIPPACVDTSSNCVVPTSCTHIGPTTIVQTNHYCQVTCSQHPAQVQAATQTTPAAAESKKSSTKATATTVDNNVKKKGRFLHRNQQKQYANQLQHIQTYQMDPNAAITQYGANVAGQCPNTGIVSFCMDVDSETESNHDTALTLACAGGHEELVELLIQHGADIEHRDKKGFTPLILAATAGHEKVVELLLKHNADIEAQSERTKDTPLSLACSGGRYEVVEILLNRNANKEHRNVSDYTPLSLAASGGYVNIIKLLLSHGAEINSRTGSKLGISPLMLAAMNGHTAAVKLLLDMGSDINAQIETNRNTALTLACFQGRHEVVSLLLDRKANVEHRAKTGLTPLMEAASGGYVEVGRVLLDKGADVNATPVPSSRDTALTIAADKGHVRFVDLLLTRGAAVEVKNKKGNSPLWLAANGGHLNVVELLHNLGADIDSQDNRKVSCLMAAYRKGHVKVVKWMVNSVTQFPSDQEMIRYMTTVSEKEGELLEKCHECIKIIRAAKETQAAKANKNASILLEELDMEKNREESKKAAAARKRERKKKKKLEKKEEKRKLFEENKKNEYYEDKDEDDDDDKEEETNEPNPVAEHSADKEEGDSGIDANSQGSCSSNDVKSKEKRKDKKKKKSTTTVASITTNTTTSSVACTNTSTASTTTASSNINNNTIKEKPFIEKVSVSGITSKILEKPEGKKEKQKSKNELRKEKLLLQQLLQLQQRQLQEAACVKSPADRDEFEPSGSDTFVTPKKKEPEVVKSSPSSTSPKQSGKREEGWKEVVRKSSVQPTQSDSGVKKVSVPLNAISRVIGRGGSNINAIRGATGAHIEVEKQSKGQGERIITIKGSTDATKQAHTLIAVLIRDPDADILQMLPKAKAPVAATTLWDKTQIGTKKVTGKVLVSQSLANTSVVQQKPVTTVAQSAVRTTTVASKPRIPTTTTAPRIAAPAPRLVAQAEKEKMLQQQQQQQRPITTPAAGPVRPQTTSANKVTTTSTVTSFAAKLIDLSSTSSQFVVKSRLHAPPPTAGPVSPNASQPQQTSTQSSPKHSNNRPVPTSSAPPNMQHVPASSSKPFTTPAAIVVSTSEQVVSQPCSPTPISTSTSKPTQEENVIMSTATSTAQVYSLFNKMAMRPMWGQEAESQKTVNFAAVTGGGGSQMPTVKFVEQLTNITIDAAKAPGYRGNAMCSPVSSKTSSNSTTPPNLPTNYHNYDKQPHRMAAIGSNIPHNRGAPSQNQNDVASNHYFDRSGPHLSHSDGNNLYGGSAVGMGTPYQPFQNSSIGQHLNYSQQQQQQQQQNQEQTNANMSRLNPKAPDFLGKNQMYNGYNSNMYSAPIAKPIGPNQYLQNTQNAWPMMQPMAYNVAPNDHLITGIAGMTLQNIARAAGDPVMFENGEMGNNSPAMSPKPLLQFAEMQQHVGEERKPQPIGIERSRKLNPNDNNGWMMKDQRHINPMHQQTWQGARIPPSNNVMDNRNAMLRPNYYDDSFNIDLQTHSGGGVLMESNMNMPYIPQHQQMPIASGLGLDYQQDFKMNTWDSRSNNVDMPDKQQQLGWSNSRVSTNKWNS